jgi:hypothetical protein
MVDRVLHCTYVANPKQITPQGLINTLLKWQNDSLHLLIRKLFCCSESGWRVCVYSISAGAECWQKAVCVSH